MRTHVNDCDSIRIWLLFRLLATHVYSNTAFVLCSRIVLFLVSRCSLKHTHTIPRHIKLWMWMCALAQHITTDDITSTDIKKKTNRRELREYIVAELLFTVYSPHICIWLILIRLAMGIRMRRNDWTDDNENNNNDEHSVEEEEARPRNIRIKWRTFLTNSNTTANI